MNFNNIKAPKVPGGGAASALIKLGVVGGLGLYGAINSLYNVEGGHRAIVFNRIVGVKDKVLISPWFLAYETWNPLNYFCLCLYGFLGNCF